MTWLDRVPPGIAVPPVGALALPPALDARAAPRIDDLGDPLVALPPELPWRLVYDELPLPARGFPLLRSEVVDRLLAAHSALPEPFGLLVLDGWRSIDFQHRLLAYYEAQHPDLAHGFVANPDEHVLAPHTTGGAVDLTLTIDGRAVALGTDFDAFDAAAALTAFEEEPGAVRDLRRLLASCLTDAGFVPYPQEWWHWSYGEQWWAAATGREATIYGVVDAAAA
jgi:D-alanyl-D-alanine dipeptidase